LDPIPLFLISMVYDFELGIRDLAIHSYSAGSAFPGPVLQTPTSYFPFLYLKEKTTNRSSGLFFAKYFNGTIFVKISLRSVVDSWDISSSHRFRIRNINFPLSMRKKISKVMILVRKNPIQLLILQILLQVH
jgi:hypothetical protein